MIIEYQHTDIYQGEHLVLKDVCFQAHEGELIYVVGQVGSGKTSLLRTIYGELTPVLGRADVMGFDMCQIKASKLPSLRKQIGIVFQDFQLLPDRSVSDNLDFVLQATGWNKKKNRERRIAEVLEQVGLPGKADSKPYELSGGEQQRICIARAILNMPRLIIADEPTGNLDADNGRNIIALLNSIRQTGAAVIITTHNMQWLEETPGTVLRCHGGLLEYEQFIKPELSDENLSIGDATTIEPSLPDNEPKPQNTNNKELKSIDEVLMG